MRRIASAINGAFSALSPLREWRHHGARRHPPFGTFQNTLDRAWEVENAFRGRCKIFSPRCMATPLMWDDSLRG
ncbi:MAG: hypothetical protein CM15mP74_17060 [Halieaceae bacterium]|nr:MAG: hypothetical protein CM15mP74_17060 [Halieaceae bacterium]